MKKFKIIAGPCLAESTEMLQITVEKLLSIFSKFNNIDFYFKASYKKANRSSIQSFTGVGDDIALNGLDNVRKKYNIKVLTDIHTAEDASKASQYVDVLQIPAFLCRQTDLLIAAGTTGLPINIKKGQFLAPDDMKKVAAKVVSTGNNNVGLTERGTSFGYHDLVVDFRGLITMKEFGFPVIYDATHSLQLPSIGEQSGGSPQFILPLARAATAVGVDGIFFETHPNPAKAQSDSQTQIPLDNVEKFIDMIMKYILN